MVRSGPGCKLLWCEPVNARSRSSQIVVFPPCLDDSPGVPITGRHVLVQAFITEASDEAFGESVLHRFAWRDEVPFDGALLAPTEHDVRREFGTVARDDQERVAAVLGDPVQFSCNPSSRDRVIDHNGQAFSGEVVDHTEHPETSVLDQHVRGELHRPAFVGALAWGMVMGARVPKARLRPSRLRKVSHYSR